MGWKHGRGCARAVLAVAGASAMACAMPVTSLEPISPERIRAEELKQQQLVVDWQVRQLSRIENVGHTLLAAANSYCQQTAAQRPGLLFLTATDFGAPLVPAARALGYSDTLIIVNVARGSAAERAGLRSGDRVITIEGRPAPRGTAARDEALRRIAKPSTTDVVTVEVLRNGRSPAEAASAPSRHTFSFSPEIACPFGLAVHRDDAVNAFADGRNVYVTTGMLRFVEDDDQLATVMAHEVAHNAMGHSSGKQRNAALGALLGAIIDIGAATQGIDTRGEFTKTGANAGALVFSQDFEREADYVGMYILTGAGRSIARAPDLWRRMAQENPKSIIFAGSHPTSAERFVRLDAAVGEIEQKIARGEVPRPEMRNPQSVLAAAAPPAPQPVPALAPARLDSARTTVAAQPAPPHARQSRISRLLRRPAPATTPSGPPPMPLDDESPFVEWTFGAPVARDGLTLEQVITQARRSYEEGVQAREVGWLDRARDHFYQATQLDGGEGRYHAALGDVLLRTGHRTEAEAVLSAATLLEPENTEYRRLLLEARKGK